jgi:hypothetical protein
MCSVGRQLHRALQLQVFHVFSVLDLWLVFLRVMVLLNSTYSSALTVAANAAGVTAAPALKAAVDALPALSIFDGIALWFFAVFNFLILIMVSCLFGVHVKMITRNITTIESAEQQHLQYARQFASSAIDMTHRYDLGTMRNISDVLGPQPLLWFIPIDNVKGDGHSYPTRNEIAAIATI